MFAEGNVNVEKIGPYDQAVFCLLFYSVYTYLPRAMYSK